jgi:hypothetical protein
MSVPKRLVLLAIMCVLIAPVTIRGQEPQNNDDSVAEETSARAEILQSRRWRQTMRSFNEWLSVRKLNTEEQVAEFQARLERQVASMSEAELEDFLDDTEERLEVLLSDEAIDARHYLSFLSDEGRQRRLGGEAPDVFDITVSQLRQELNQFQQQRASRAAAQAQFNRQREQRVSAAKRDQQTQQEAKTQARRDRGAASHGTPQGNLVRSRYAPRRDPRPRRDWIVGPWGGLYRSLP